MAEYIIDGREYMEGFVGDPIRSIRELIRCKDCKHHGKDTCSAGAGIAFPPPDDWFCADGERK